MSVPVFVDTSALYAALAADDRHHEEAAEAWQRLLDGLAAHRLATVLHSGIVTESTALVQRRLGIPAARTLLDEILPLCKVVWVDRELHDAAATGLLAAGRRDVSLVDWTSFVVMRRRGIEHALAFDVHFVEQGFELFR